jgi:hypothetical protein
MKNRLVKAKRIDTQKWVKGLVYDVFDEKAGKFAYFINEHSFEGASLDYPYPTYQCIEHEVDPETVCLLSPITDNKNTPIWECDIVKLGDSSIAEVKFLDNQAAFVTRDIFGEYQFLYNIENWTTITVVGNRFDNPELLELSSAK